MRITILAVSVVVWLGLSLDGRTAAAAGEWQIDPAHSQVAFSVRHMGVSNVKGHFNDFAGQVKADPLTGKLTEVLGTVKISSVDTGIAKRDEHLKSDDFFNAAKFPEMKLRSKKITIGADNKVTLVADLTIRDVTKEVTFAGEYLGANQADLGNGKQARAGYSAVATINRKDFGLKFGAVAEGISVVADQVKIELDIEMFRAL